MELLTIILFGICNILLTISEISYIYKLKKPTISLQNWLSAVNRLIIFVLFIIVIILVDLPILVIYPAIQTLAVLIEVGWMVYIFFAKWLDQRREFKLINGDIETTKNLSDDVL
jgi:hypothetical protein